MSEKHLPTERLYYHDSHLLRFDARVLECRQEDDRWLAVLDRTAFYPTGGGQPNDLGRLGEATVHDCIDADEFVLHVVDRSISGNVSGEIDPARRRDHLQQHTGQHILSQAFIQLAGAKTRGFHLGTESSTIDIDLENPSAELIARVEELANRIVFEDRPVTIHLTNEQSLDRFQLRKETDRSGCVRIIEIADFDNSPCGGTHAKRTGEVGMIVVRATERVKKMTRVEFLCGERARKDYHTAHQTALATATLFSAARDAAPALVARLQQEQKQLQRRVRELLELALESEARRLLEAVKPNSQGVRIISTTFTDRALDEVKSLAHLLVADSQVIALLGTKDGTPKIVFARSNGLADDCGKMLSGYCQSMGGRGGGKADFAQGGVPADAAWEVALRELAASLQG